MDSTNALQLYDYRLRVAALYRRRDDALANGVDPCRVWDRFRRERDALLGQHPQSALDSTARAHFDGIEYFPYNPACRVEGTLAADTAPVDLTMEDNGKVMEVRSVGTLHFAVEGRPCTLTLYWIDVYGGGLFLPFRDATAPDQTYGGGRYLVDSSKGSIFPRLAPEAEGWRVTLDFNYAYNPSCAYDPRWACPLAPPTNHLPVAIQAGELVFNQP